MRGRKKEPDAVKVAKGDPGKRVPRRKRSADVRAAELAGTKAAVTGSLEPPDFLTNEALAPALKIWRELAPALIKVNLLQRIDRYSFARWCTYQADWIEATNSIAKDGIWTNVPNVNGDLMPRRNPACLHREKCETAMQSLESAFGLTPAHRYKVLRDQAASAASGGLFDELAKSEPASPASPKPETGSPVGLMGRLAAETAGQRPN